MFGLDNQTIETIGVFIGVVITVMIFSYLLTDKLLFRWGLALLVGCGVGYTLGLAVRFFIVDLWGQLNSAKSVIEKIFVTLPLLLGLLLCLRSFASSKRLGWLAAFGNISVGYLVGVGTAVAISGAILGTIIPQVTASGTAMNMQGWQGIIVIVGVVTSLLTFSPLRHEKDGHPNPVMLWLQRFGRVFIIVALAVAFSGALTSALTALVVRCWYIFDLLYSFFGKG